MTAPHTVDRFDAAVGTVRPAPRRTRRPRDGRRPAVGAPRYGAVRVVSRPRGVAAPDLPGGSRGATIRAAALPDEIRRVRVGVTEGAVRLTDRGVAVVIGTGAGLMLASLVTVVVTAVSVTG